MKSLYSYIILLILTLQISGSFAQKADIDPDGYNKFYYDNGVVSSEGNMVDGKPEGFWKTYYPTGILKTEGNRRNFLLDSIWDFYNEYGRIKKKITYKFDKKTGYYSIYKYSDEDTIGYLVSKELYLDDVKKGDSYYYYKTGEIRFITNYTMGIKDGLTKELSRDTAIISLIYYNNGYILNKETINRKDKSGLKQGTWKELYSNDKIKKEENFFNDTLHGYYREFSKKGELLVNLKYNMGVIIDEREEYTEEDFVEIKKEYHPNGNLKTKATYSKGKLVGAYREYDEDGKLVKSKLYSEKGVLLGKGLIDEKERKQGKWILLYDTGERKSIGKYKNNRKIGKWEYLFKNGELEQAGNFKKGKPNGEWKWYFKGGDLEREENYTSGKNDGLFIEYDKDGELLTKGEYVDGYKEGEWFYHVGDHTAIGVYKEDLKEGVWIYYFENGKVKFKGSFNQGFPDGKHKFYHDNGKLQEEGLYIMGKKEKNWRKFDKTGTLLTVITFKDGEQIKIDGIKLKYPKEK